MRIVRVRKSAPLLFERRLMTIEEERDICERVAKRLGMRKSDWSKSIAADLWIMAGNEDADAIELPDFLGNPLAWGPLLKRITDCAAQYKGMLGVGRTADGQYYISMPWREGVAVGDSVSSAICECFCGME